MMHPRYEVEKEYIVKLDRPVEMDDLARALKGIYIDIPKPYRIKRYDLMPRTREFVRITLIEGKNREIRKIFSFLGYNVKALTRIRIGCVELDELKPGEWRDLTREEISGLLSGSNEGERRPRRRIRVESNDNRN